MNPMDETDSIDIEGELLEAGRRQTPCFAKTKKNQAGEALVSIEIDWRRRNEEIRYTREEYH